MNTENVLFIENKKLVTYQETIRIESYQTDCHKFLTAPMLLNLITAVAANHSSAVGCGWEVLHKRNLFWALSRITIDIIKPAMFGDLITIKTWSRGCDRLFGYRDYEVTDESGEVIVKSTSSWVLMNVLERVVEAPINYMQDYPKNSDQIFDVNAQKIPKIKDGIIKNRKCVDYTEIDLNGHLNNSNYIVRLINAHDSAFLMKNRLSKIDINYLKEAVIDQDIEVSMSKLAELTFSCSILDVDSKRELVRTRSSWKRVK